MTTTTAIEDQRILGDRFVSRQFIPYSLPAALE
jgi:hypothetical protein